MKISLFWIVVVFLLLYYPIALLHESLHYLPAISTGAEPKFVFTLTEHYIEAMPYSIFDATIIALFPLLIFINIFLVLVRFKIFKKIRWLTYLFFAWAFSGTFFDIRDVFEMLFSIDITIILSILYTISLFGLFYAGAIIRLRTQNQNEVTKE